MLSLSQNLIVAGRGIARLPLWLAATALFFLMVMTFCDVMLRSVFNNPIEAATELTRICMAIIVFSALPVVSARGGHIAVDLLDPFFRGIVARVRSGIVDLVSGTMLIWPARQCFILAERARDYGDLTEYLAIPQFYIAHFIAIATSITVVVLILRGLIELFAPDAMRVSEPVPTTYD